MATWTRDQLAVQRARPRDDPTLDCVAAGRAGKSLCDVLLSAGGDRMALGDRGAG